MRWPRAATRWCRSAASSPTTPARSRRSRRGSGLKVRAGPGELGRLARRGLRPRRQHPAQPDHGRRRPAGAAGFGIGFKESWEQAIADIEAARRQALRDPCRRVGPPAGRPRLRPLGAGGRAAGGGARRVLRHDHRLLGHRQHAGGHDRRLRRRRSAPRRIIGIDGSASPRRPAIRWPASLAPPPT